MKIGELASQTGLAATAIRFYERSGLLPAAERGVNGYRRYGESDVQRLHLIRIAQALGFSLDVMRRVFDDGQQVDDAQVQRTLERRLREIDAQMATLRQQRRDVVALQQTLRDAWAADACIDAQALSKGLSTPPARAVAATRKPRRHASG